MQRVVFMGTPDFAVPSLKHLIDNGYKITGVFCQPDKPKGRGHKLAYPPVKEFAIQNNLDVFQPATLRNDDAVELIKSLEPEVIVVAAYGKILPKSILEIPKFGCINVHGSLLPKYRGAAPIQWAVLNGDKVSGVTTMFMGEGLDTGDMLLKCETEIGKNETSPELFDRLAILGAELLIKTLKNIETIIPKKQDEREATYSKMIDKSLCPIDWSKSAQEIHNKVRGLAEWPVAITVINGKKIKVHSGIMCDNVGDDKTYLCGSVVDNKKKLVVACGNNSFYEIKVLQLEGKKRMNADAFLLGNKIEIGERFE